ncbi:hypothetical protein ONZ45_g18223 [Pleurotus djamor]|nr:hypothetical protein ONZ45_g18223 [Pleurotus djamor]
MIAKILPLLTQLTHFELNRVYAYYSFRELPSKICSPHLSTFIWQTEGKDQDKLDLVAFLETHPSIKWLEIPAYEFNAALPSALLPCVRKLAIFDCKFLSNHPLQKTISHLAISSSEDIADTKTAEKFSKVQYFTGFFNPIPFMSFASKLPDVRYLYFAPDELTRLKDICHAAQSQKFQSKDLVYLVILCDKDEHEDYNSAIQGIFKAIPTLRVIDVFNYIVHDAFARYHAEGSPTSIPLAQFPSKWPTEQQLKEALL